VVLVLFGVVVVVLSVFLLLVFGLLQFFRFFFLFSLLVWLWFGVSLCEGALEEARSVCGDSLALC
jgi:hypothetical protein